MSRKDYERMAQALRISQKEASIDVLRTIADELAIVFKSDNPRFDKDKFMVACGL